MNNEYMFGSDSSAAISFTRTDASTQDRQVKVTVIHWPYNLDGQKSPKTKELHLFDSVVSTMDKLHKLNKGEGVVIDIYDNAGALVGTVSQINHTLETKDGWKVLTISGMVDISHTNPLWGDNKRRKLKIEPVFLASIPVHEHRKPEIFDLLKFVVSDK